MRGVESEPIAPQPSSNITALLREWEAGRPEALSRLTEAAYPELRHIAHRYYERERRSHTLQTTAVVHEAWLRLAQVRQRNWKDRTHFFAFAAFLMRRILVDYARSRRARKRRGTGPLLAVADGGAAPAPDVDILELNDALEELEKMDPLQGRIVELRYFSGLTVPETAEVTAVSESTVKREWTMAKTWIRRRLLDRCGQP